MPATTATTPTTPTTTSTEPRPVAMAEPDLVALLGELVRLVRRDQVIALVEFAIEMMHGQHGGHPRMRPESRAAAPRCRNPRRDHGRAGLAGRDPRQRDRKPHPTNARLHRALGEALEITRDSRTILLMTRPIGS